MYSAAYATAIVNAATAMRRGDIAIKNLYTAMRNFDTAIQNLDTAIQYSAKAIQIHKARKNRQTPQNNHIEFWYLVLTLKHVPPKPLQNTPHKITLPNSLHPFPSVCLILGDGDGDGDDDDHIHKIIKSQDIPISKVVKLSKLRSSCDRKDFWDCYDVCLADERIVSLLPSILGKRKVAIPVSVKGVKKNRGLSLKEEVEKACFSEVLSFGSGSCCSVRVGRRGVTRGAQIVENVRAAVDRVVQFVPDKWKGVTAIHFKFTDDSVIMPIYTATAVSSNEGALKLEEVELAAEGAFKLEEEVELAADGGLC